MVVAAPESRQQLLVRNNGRVKVHPDGLAVVAYPVIRWGRGGPAGITDTRADDPFNAPEPGVVAPESAEGEISRFQRALIRRVQQGEYRFYSLNRVDSTRGCRTATAVDRNKEGTGQRHD